MTSGDSPSSGSGGSLSDTGCDPEATVCDAEILTPHEIFASCAGTQFELELQARCKCDEPGTPRQVTWSMRSDVSDLVLSDDGELSGAPPGGTHELEITVIIDHGRPVTKDFELQVLDRCLVLYLTEDQTSGKSIIAAAQLDSDDEPLPLPKSSDASVSAFEVSPDGRYVAQVEATANGEQLALLRLEGNSIASTEFQHPGEYLLHAFSRDSRWLALLTANEEDSTPQGLHLVDLASSPIIVDFVNVNLAEGLTWSDAGHILYYGQSALTGLAAQEREINDGSIGAEVEYRIIRSSAMDEPFHRFLIGETGFLAVFQGRLFYAQRGESEAYSHPLAEGVSPNLDWVANHDPVGVRIDPLSERYAADNPFATAPGCSIVKAWSLGGRRLACLDGSSLLTYEVSGESETLDETPLDLPHGFEGPIQRMAFSAAGDWLALVPGEDGLRVLPMNGESSEAFENPELAPPDGTYEWDFFFSPNGRHFVVQQGRALWIAQLQTGSLTLDMREIGGVTLPAVPQCRYAWHPEPELWCGAPKFRGNLGLSRAERHLAFQDDKGRVHTVDLETGQVLGMGTISPSCSSNCIQFQ